MNKRKALAKKQKRNKKDYHLHLPKGDKKGNLHLEDSKLNDEFAIQVDMKPTLLINSPKLRKRSKQDAIVPNQESEDQDKKMKILPGTKKTSDEQKLICSALKQHYLLFSMAQKDIQQFVEEMSCCEFKKGETFIEQGKSVNYFFIIKSGKISKIINGFQVKELTSGACVSEASLLYKKPSEYTATCLEDCQLWCLQNMKFQTILNSLNIETMERSRKYLLQIPFFQMLTQMEQDSLAEAAYVIKYPKDVNFIHQGHTKDSLHIIIRGQIELRKMGKPVFTLNAGDYFGESNIYGTPKKLPIAYTIEESVVIQLTSEMVDEQLGEPLKFCILRNVLAKGFENSKKLKYLSDVQKEKIVNIMNNRVFEDEVCFKKGERKDNKLLMILEGQLNYEDKTVFFNQPLQFVNEDSFFDGKDEVWEKDIVYQGKVKVSFIYKEEIKKLLRMDIKTLVEVQQKRLGAKKKMTFDDVEKCPPIEQLKVLKTLGQGQFGKVLLVSDGNIMFAAKIIAKRKMKESDFRKFVKREKSILKMIQNPFIMMYNGCHRIDDKIFIFTEFINGLELFDALRDIGLLTLEQGRFYTAQVILMLEYLHSTNIIYRDLKPENMIVNHDGFLKLIDLGTAKILQRNKEGYLERTFTILGSPHYLAPEVLEGKGYTFTSDFYSLGVVFYEFICGCLPFGEDLDDPYEIYKVRMNCNYLPFPKWIDCRGTKTLIRRFLSRQAHKRFKGWGQLKANEIFDHIEWDQLNEREVEPFYKPKDHQIINSKMMKKLIGKGEKFLEYIEK